MNAVADKQRLRAAARKCRAEAQAGDHAGRAAHQVAEHFIAAFASASGFAAGTVVAGYWPLGSELDVRPLMYQLAQAGADLVLPVTRTPDLPLEFRRWRPGDGLHTGAHGVMQPDSTAPVAIPTVLLVPLLAFDGVGWRLGYGAGYYDRTLAELRGRMPVPPILAVGIAYAVQEVAELPHHGGDQRLDGVVTERAARRFA